MIDTQRVQQLLTSHPDVTIVMAVKYLPASGLQSALGAGLKHFGENRVEALLEKQAALNDPQIVWHFFGTLQTKKVKHIIQSLDVLHSLDRLTLAAEIAKRRQEPLPCFIQINISHEPQKHGLEPHELGAFLEAIKAYPVIVPIGLMGMAEDTDDVDVIRAQFRRLRETLKAHQTHTPTLVSLSMGMSNDYEIAIEEGATHLRLGRILLAEQTGV